MVIYEVNLKVTSEAVPAFREWLADHIAEMLTFDGFEKATWFEEAQDDEGKSWVIHYQVKSEDDLQSYFDNHAASMRAEGIKRFPDQFSASRRILPLYRAVEPQAFEGR